MSSRGAEPHDHEPARQPTLAAYAPEPVLPPAASAPDWRSRQGRWVDRSLSGRHHLPWCRGLFRPVAKSNPCTIPRSKRQRPSYRSRPHTPNLWTVPKTVASSGRCVVYGGVEHLTIRLTDDTLTLTPAWMMRPEAAMCAVRPFPRLCVGRLRDLRNHLDVLLGSSPGDSSRARGADHAPEATPRAGPVRKAPGSTSDPTRASRGDGRDSASASDRGAVGRGGNSDPEGGAP